MPAPKVKSKDPIQQKLRDNKRKWNSSYRDFSQKLKAFKDGINGKGNLKLNIPPSDIKEPFPPEMGAFLDNLSSQFQQLVGGANSIISEQDAYSRNRRKRQEIKRQPKENSPLNVLERLGSAELNKEASSKVSRFWQYLTSIFSNKEYNKQRIGLLRQASDLYYSLLDFENSVLDIKIQSIPKAISDYKKFKYNFIALSDTFKALVELVEEKGSSISERSEKTVSKNQPASKVKKPQVADFNKIEKDAHALFNAEIAKEQANDMLSLINDYKSEEDDNIKSMLLERLGALHKETISNLAQEAKDKDDSVNTSDVENIIEILKKNASLNIMIKNSHNVLTRFIKKQLIKAIPFNKTAPARLEIVEILADLKKNVQMLMDSLEKGLSFEDIKKYIEIIDHDLVRIKRPLHVLNTYYMKEYFSKSKITDDQDKNLDYILRRKLRRELSEDLA